MFDKILIANRGAIACRVIRTLKKMHIASVAVYSEADAQSLHVVDADEAYSLGEGAAAHTYLNQQRIIDIARKSGAQAIHPRADGLERCSGCRIGHPGLGVCSCRAHHLGGDMGLHTARRTWNHRLDGYASNRRHADCGRVLGLCHHTCDGLDLFRCR